MLSKKILLGTLMGIVSIFSVACVNDGINPGNQEVEETIESDTIQTEILETEFVGPFQPETDKEKEGNKETIVFESETNEQVEVKQEEREETTENFS